MSVLNTQAAEDKEQAKAASINAKAYSSERKSLYTLKEQAIAAELRELVSKVYNGSTYETYRDKFVTVKADSPTNRSRANLSPDWDALQDCIKDNGVIVKTTATGHVLHRLPRAK